MRIHPTFHVSLLKCFVPGPLNEGKASSTPPEPLKIDEQPAYVIIKILRSRRRVGQIKYLINWEGYGPEAQSCVKSWNILDPLLKKAFHLHNPAQPASRPRGLLRSCEALSLISIQVLYSGSCTSVF